MKKTTKKAVPAKKNVQEKEQTSSPSCHYCGAKQWEMSHGDEVYPGYDGYPLTSCCNAC